MLLIGQPCNSYAIRIQLHKIHQSVSTIAQFVLYGQLYVKYTVAIKSKGKACHRARDHIYMRLIIVVATSLDKNCEEYSP